MGQVAFDTQEFVETLENAGLPKEQAKAISIAVRKSHEVADVATKQDIAEVNRNIADVRKDMDLRFEKSEAQIADVRKDLSAEIADVRKDMSARFEKNEAQIQARFEKTDAQIALIRKDVEHIATGLLLKLGGVIVVTISAATAILKFF
ncbi:hypothetical protein QE197_11860 [Arsenophonus nasoniae]|uniref:DUF1640 domain-containing protein n=1 Tax=Arsenophonus nasoniae TaxID=638 RepID=A0A4P7L5G7_9GAMM|nr:hypothetical protein [Arsenophonus nasoniae]QBY44162.1 hypothetical protein ArsFIN_27390 [Arsenophonus nasoniae]WGM04462.1 hypothetical protein QE258_12590 [Arsenophonus nasoniae]WGM09568.1 hypothetical protein QE197_11860 [Arsenophonus nasoniae]WGM14289.1 hypothetical protein QE193_11755 [Arsenophonus nasoniae]